MAAKRLDRLTCRGGSTGGFKEGLSDCKIAAAGIDRAAKVHPEIYSSGDGAAEGNPETRDKGAKGQVL